MENTENTITENTIIKKPLYWLEGSGGPSGHTIDICAETETGFDDYVSFIHVDTYEECLEIAFQKVLELGGEIHPDCMHPDLINDNYPPLEDWEIELYKKYFG